MKDSLRKVKAILVFLVLMSSVLSAMHARLLYYHVDWTVTCHIHNLYGLYHKLEQTTMLIRYVPNLIFQCFFFNFESCFVEPFMAWNDRYSAINKRTDTNFGNKSNRLCHFPIIPEVLIRVLQDIKQELLTHHSVGMHG